MLRKRGFDPEKDELSKFINIQSEAGVPELEKIANKEDAIILALISPYAGVRVSPVERRFATIGLHEEFGIENVLERIQESTSGKVKKLFLMINTPGGSPTSSYKIAHMLQEGFEDIHVFVTHIAASGGTLIAMCGRTLTLGKVGHLTPVDVQVPYKDTVVSATSVMKALWRLNKEFADKLPEEAPYPLRSMANQLDPIILEEWTSALTEIVSYASEILENSGYESSNISRIIDSTVFNDYSHRYVIHHERAKKLGFKLDDSKKMLGYLQTMRKWLGCYALKPESRHFIRYVIPDKYVSKKYDEKE